MERKPITITLRRVRRTPAGTFGRLTCQCPPAEYDTLEPPAAPPTLPPDTTQTQAAAIVRQAKKQNLARGQYTAIPPGTYPVFPTYSPRYSRILPRLASVPGFEGILIHPGNTAADTKGCILPGTLTPRGDTIRDSRNAADNILRIISDARAQGHGCFITITEPPPVY